MIRNFNIDIMRSIGLLMIILAHVNPPGFIFQLRNFDVPLMVLVSGLSFALTYRAEPYLSYILKRIKRLVFPVWFFLSFYFLLNYFLAWPVELPGISTILGSYFLTWGIGYVWIIRVFLLVALLAPFIYRISKNESSDFRFLIKLLLIFLAYECSLNFFVMKLFDSTLGSLLEEQMYYLISYGLVFALGLRLKQFSKATIGFLAVFFATIFISECAWNLMQSGVFKQTQLYKYPPSSYYLSYALLVSVLIWINIKYISLILSKCRAEGFVEFLSANSIWIYLWHIPLISIFQINFLPKYFLVLSGAIVIVFIQIKFVKLICVRTNNISFKNFILNTFIG